MSLVIPTVVLGGIGLAGRWALREEQNDGETSALAKTAALGGFAEGILIGWCLATAIRTALVFVWSFADWQILWASPLLFTVELWVLLLIAAAEVFSLEGHYSCLLYTSPSPRDS